ncbi:MAG TPA: tetratricopeptide repeat protein [Pyrinomonadaceae bacterium]|nr:tetratricopeptide repeat protein [Pyrinomonadaceae bacterium]
MQSGFQDWLLDAIFELVVKTIFQRLAPICTASLIVVVSISTSAFNTPQDNYERLDQVANLIRTGDVSAAERELQLILRSQPSDPNALNLLGVVRVQQQRPVDAEKLFLSAIRHSPKLVGGYVNLGRLYQGQHKIERAQWAYAEAAKLAPDNSEINYQLASLSVDQGDFAKALLDIQRIPVSSWRAEEYYIATNSYLNLNQPDKAIDLIEYAERAHWLESEEAATAFASLLVKAKLPARAISILEKAIEKNPNSIRLKYELGSAYAGNKQWANAEDSFNAVLKLDANNIAALRGLATIARAHGELERALAYLVQARRLAPENLQTLYDFSVVAFSLDLILDALPVAEKLYSTDTKNPAYVHLLAVSKFRHDEREAAERLLREYIQLKPKEALGYYLLGVTLYTGRRYAEARESLARSLSFGPNSDSAYVMALIAQSEKDNTSAVKWLREVAPDSESYAPAQTLLGIVYAEQNNLSLARSTLENAVQLNPKDLRATYQLALIYSKSGEKEKARELFAIADTLREAQRNQEVVKFKLIEPPQ